MPNNEEYAKHELAQIKAGLMSSLVSSLTRNKQNISPEEVRKLAETLLVQFPDEVKPEPQKKVVWPLNPNTLTSVTAYDLLKILKDLGVLPTISFTTSAKDVIIGRKSPDVPDQRKLKERFPEGANDLNEELFFMGDKKFYVKFFDNTKFSEIDEHLFITFSVINYDKLVIDEFKFTKAELMHSSAPAVAEFEFYIRQDKKDGELLSFKDFYLVKETYGVIDADLALHSLHPVQGFTTKVLTPDHVNALAIFNRATEFFESRHLLGFKKSDIYFNDITSHLVGKNAKVGNPGDHTDIVIRYAAGFCSYINKDIINCERLNPDYEDLLCGHYENKEPIEPSAKFNQKLLEHVYEETRSGVVMNVFLTGAKDVDTLKKRLEKYLQSIIDVNKEFADNEELKNSIEAIESREKELQKLRNELTEFKGRVAKKHLKAFEIKANSEGFEV